MGLVVQLKAYVATDPAFCGVLSLTALEAVDKALEVPGAALWIVNEILVRNKKTKREVAIAFRPSKTGH